MLAKITSRKDAQTNDDLTWRFDVAVIEWLIVLAMLIILSIVGAVARTGLSGFFMGNTAESILSQLDCSVLAVKPPGLVTPVSLEG